MWGHKESRQRVRVGDANGSEVFTVGIENVVRSFFLIVAKWAFVSIFATEGKGTIQELPKRM